MNKITIGNKQCETRVVSYRGRHYGELLIDGKQFDVTAWTDNEETAEKRLKGMVTMYKRVLKQNSCFASWVREHFT